jgi:hypothetical protein
MVLDMLPCFLSSAKPGIESLEEHLGVNEPWLAFEGFEGIESPFLERCSDSMTRPKPLEFISRIEPSRREEWRPRRIRAHALLARAFGRSYGSAGCRSCCWSQPAWSSSDENDEK